MIQLGIRQSRDQPVSKPRSNSYPQDIHQESIYHLIPKVYEAPSKPDLYRSMYAGQARREYKAHQKKAASMGPLKVPREEPQNFLKSHVREQRAKTQCRTVEGKTSHVHGHGGRELWESWKPKAVPIQPSPAHIKSTKKSTELDNYRLKKDYGRPPAYLSDRKEELHQQAEKKKLQQQNASLTHSDFIQLPEQERLHILEGLKRNWQRLNTEYMKLSLVVDTVPKINRKVNFEAQLKRLEEDIEKFSRPNVVIKL